jgi:hypothetical protein
VKNNTRKSITYELFVILPLFENLAFYNIKNCREEKRGEKRREERREERRGEGRREERGEE